MNSKIVVTINLQYFIAGRFDLYLFTYSCTGCDQQFSPLTLEKIINEGYWPGGPKNLNYIFCEDVFRVWDSLRKYMPGTSETAFLKSLPPYLVKRAGLVNHTEVTVLPYK
jgi:hypothetical protein